jgi:murein DD-endopeptidase MepM/ murein hydrolase activator NlpD
MADEIKATGNEVPFGSFIPASTIKQIQVRGNLLAKDGKSLEEIRCTNACAPWIVFRSGVNVGDDGANTAKRCTLLGGEQTGIGGANRRSGLGTRGVNAYGQDSVFGMRPMPGITNMTVKNLDTWGCVREATVTFSVWSKGDLEDMSKVFFRPGYSALLEWGHSIYITNSGKIENSTAAMCISDEEWFNTNKSLLDFDDELKERRKQYDGNYDGLCGLITNFSYSLQKTGGFECTVKMLSRGSVIFSTKSSNSHTFLTDIKNFLVFTLSKGALTGAGSGRTDVTVDDSKTSATPVEQRPSDTTPGFNALYLLENMESKGNSTVERVQEKATGTPEHNSNFYRSALRLLPLFEGSTFPIYKYGEGGNEADWHSADKTVETRNSLAYIRLRDFLWLLSKTVTTGIDGEIRYDLSTPYKFAVIPGMISLNPLVAALAQNFTANGQQSASVLAPDTTATSFPLGISAFGYLCFPLQDDTGNTTIRWTSGFYRTDGTYHGGIDLACPIGTQVRAIADGIVTICKRQQDENGKTVGGGEYVAIRHANGYVSRYMHLSSYSVKPGQVVTKGEKIGLSGNTGHSTGPHLHLDIADAQGNKFDPATLEWHNGSTEAFGFHLKFRAAFKLGKTLPLGVLGGNVTLDPMYNLTRGAGTTIISSRSNFVCNAAKWYLDSKDAADAIITKLGDYDNTVLHPAISSNCIGDIHLNVRYLISKLESMQNSDENAGVGSLLQAILADVGKSFGGINDFGLFITEGNLLAVVDRNYIDPYSATPAISKEDVTIPVSGKRSSMVQVEIKSAITPNIANQMSIAATAPRDGKTAATNPASLLYLNGNYIDRHRIPGSNAIDAEGNTVDTASSGSGEEEAPEWIATTIKAYNDMFDAKDSGSFQELFNTFDSVCPDWAPLIGGCWNSQVINGSTEQESAFQTGVVPIELGLDMKGISGFLVGSCFKIESGLTLDEYNNWGYIVTGVDQSVNTGGWISKIRTQYFPLLKDLKK